METIGQLNIISELQKLNENLTLWLAESNDGQLYEVLTIKQDKDYQALLERILRNEILPLVNQEIEGIQDIVAVDFDTTCRHHYIVYKYFEGFEIAIYPTIKCLKSILVGLEKLKRQNRFGQVITNETILCHDNEVKLRFVGLFDLFKHQGLLPFENIAPECKNGAKPNFQSDIYSVFKVFEGLRNESTDEHLNALFSTALSEKRTDRFSKYSEILEALDKVKVAPINIHNTKQSTVKVIVRKEEYATFQPVLDEMNISCYILLESDRSKDKDQIMGMFSTKNHSGRFFVDPEGHIFIPVQAVRNAPLKKVEQQGFESPHNFGFNPTSYINCFRFFNEKWENHNTITALNKDKHRLVKKWMTLPDKEREFIEERALKAIYVRREESKSNRMNIRFQLTEKFRDWETIKDLKRNEISLFIDDTIIGEIHDYNPKDCSLIIKDCKVTLDEIPQKGEIHQDVRLETSQFKKQVEACKKFENKDIVNPTLGSILATPERIPTLNRIDIDYDGFKEEVINPNLRTDDTQRDAVLEALHHKPVYLIQGPPGTGKTTVIVELIQQIIRQNTNAKILVTSQSNLAVDNVLKRLPENVLFMRLAASEDRIDDKIKAHSFQNKLKNWVEDTQVKSNGFIQQHFEKTIRNKALLKFYDFYCNINLVESDAYSTFLNLLGMQSQYIQKLFANASTISQVESVFNEELGEEFKKLKRIQKDWFAFLANAESDEGSGKKSMLNNGSVEVDLRTAFVQSVNVIGATCIHIASAQYKNVDFRFDYVIMDESSKASPAETLVPINMGQNIVLIGDHKQLPPVVTREEAVKTRVKEELDDNGLDIEKEFGESLFEKLIMEFEANANLQMNIKMLDIQYRMPRQIGNLISRFFYDGKLKNPDHSVIPHYDFSKSHELKLKPPKVSINDTIDGSKLEVPNSIVFISTSHLPNSNDNDNKFDRRNPANKKVIEEILNDLDNQYPNNLTRDEPFTVGIIAGYRGQVSSLQDGIDLFKYSNFVATDQDGRQESLIEINTVDKFQGAERDIIIYDIVKSSKGSSSIGFLDDYRRINVAFSRVKRLLIVVGDSEFLLKRAILNPNGKFKEFKLKEIVAELENEGLIATSLNEVLL